MVVHIHTVAFEGIEVIPVDIQVQIVSGVPAFTLVGLPDKAVAESRERVRAALEAMGLSLPVKRITVNLSPADLAKEGSHYDLPIALGILAAMGVAPADVLETYLAMGELSLDGKLLPVSGVLPSAMHAVASGKGLICPQGNGAEARWAGEYPLLAPVTLLSLLNHFKGTQSLPEIPLSRMEIARPVRDMAEIRGQVTAKRALEIAAAGGHNLLMVGPPGSGKSMLAACLPGILPPMQSAEILESSMIASLAGKLPGGMLCTARPFRDPHHSASMAAMVGGGKRPMPGEISLAHHGVLFMDELPEFPSHVLEALRQPLETRQVTISRASAHVTYPARFQLIAAMNPCRCGYVSQPAKACSKAPLCAGDYQARLSGPLLDRIDLHVEVPEVPVAEMFTTHSAEASSTVAARVARAREVQRQRFERAGLTATYTNSDVSGERIRAFAEPDPEGQALLLQATDKLGLSMRGLSRVLKTARTIADLAGSAEVHKPHLAEALSYRQLRVGR